MLFCSPRSWSGLPGSSWISARPYGRRSAGRRQRQRKSNPRNWRRGREQEVVERLQQIMTQKAAYRDAAVAIASLAARLGITEKKLRELINGKLGFRSFASYVNAFRLEEVRRRLLNPRQDEVPILTMALEAGFGSIVAFNRAFKDKYRLTPSAYRVHRPMAVASPDCRSSPAR